MNPRVRDRRIGPGRARTAARSHPGDHDGEPHLSHIRVASHDRAVNDHKVASFPSRPGKRVAQRPEGTRHAYSSRGSRRSSEKVVGFPSVRSQLGVTSIGGKGSSELLDSIPPALSHDPWEYLQHDVKVWIGPLVQQRKMAGTGAGMSIQIVERGQTAPGFSRRSVVNV